MSGAAAELFSVHVRPARHDHVPEVDAFRSRLQRRRDQDTRGIGRAVKVLREDSGPPPGPSAPLAREILHGGQRHCSVPLVLPERHPDGVNFEARQEPGIVDDPGVDRWQRRHQVVSRR